MRDISDVSGHTVFYDALYKELLPFNVRVISFQVNGTFKIC